MDADFLAKIISVLLALTNVGDNWLYQVTSPTYSYGKQRRLKDEDSPCNMNNFIILTNNNRTAIMIEAKGEDVLSRTFSLIFHIKEAAVEF